MWFLRESLQLPIGFWLISFGKIRFLFHCFSSVAGKSDLRGIWWEALTEWKKISYPLTAPTSKCLDRIRYFQKGIHRYPLEEARAGCLGLWRLAHSIFESIFQFNISKWINKRCWPVGQLSFRIDTQHLSLKTCLKKIPPRLSSTCFKIMSELILIRWAVLQQNTALWKTDYWRNMHQYVLKKWPFTDQLLKPINKNVNYNFL